MFEHWPQPSLGIPHMFKLTSKTLTCSVQFPLAPDCDALKIALGNVKVKQIPVNSNIATTTGHKLQGTTKDILIVDCWSYTFANWVYLVLSRVRTLDGLFLCRCLAISTVPGPLLQERLEWWRSGWHRIWQISGIALTAKWCPLCGFGFACP